MLMWILAIICALMYTEGVLLASVAGSFSQTASWKKAIFVLLWPLTLFLVGYTFYSKVWPTLLELKGNPFVANILGGILNGPEQADQLE